MVSYTREERQQRIEELERWIAEQNEEFENDAFPGEVRDMWDKAQAELKEHRRVQAELAERDETIHRMAQLAQNREEPPQKRGGPQLIFRMNEGEVYDLNDLRTSPLNPEAGHAEMRDRAMRAVELTRFPQEKIDRADCQAHVERLMRTVQGPRGEVEKLILTTGSPVYRRAFGKTLAGASLSHDEQRALSLAGAGGGYAVPFALDPSVIPTSNSSVNPFRALARVETIAGSNTWQGVSSGAVTATRVTEGTEATDNSPTLAQPQATVTKAHVFIPYSIEIGEDWGALEAEMARLIQDAKDDEEATSFATGTGAGVNPQGIVVGATNTVNASAGATVTAANLYAVEAALPPRFRPNESWVANRSIYNIIRALDTAGGAQLWLYISQGLNTQSPRPGNTGATLLGAGAWESSAMVSTIALNAKFMVVGDFNYFLIVDRIGMTVETVPHVFGATSRYPIGQRGLYAYWRNTSKVLDANAFRVLNGQT